MKINQCNRINKRSGYIVIPFLESYYKFNGESVYNMLLSNGILKLDVKYREMCDKIDLKMRDKLVNIATMTISSTTSIKSNKKTESTKQTESTKSIKSTKSKKNSKTVGNNSLGGLQQIYLVKINNSDYNSDVSSVSLCEELRVAGHLVYNLLKNNYIRNCNLVALLESRTTKKTRDDNINSMIYCILEGMMLSSYKFDKYKTDKALNKHRNLLYTLENLYLVNGNINQEQLKRLNIIVESVFLSRDLVNEPANDNRVERYLALVENVIAKYKIPVEIEVLDKKELEKMGMGLILGVGKASTLKNAPCMIIMKYHPIKKDIVTDNEIKPDWILLGKGITYDTGGLDLKSSKSMLDMKSDLSGASAVMAFLLGYARYRGNKCIYTVCPFAENSIGSQAVKPSDVLKSYDGRTVEITNTDAEGRLVLADALAYCVKMWSHSRLLDMATLTGQAESISGKAFSCVLSTNTEKETADMIVASNIINESLVRLPILDKELDKLESYVADIKNVSYKSSADIIMSALFMKQFIKKSTPWIHIDIAGPAFDANNIIKYASPEASGVGVRLLFEYFY